MIKVNQNIQNLKPSATLAINQKVIALRKNNKNVYHFGFGESPFPIHQTIVNALKKNAANKHYLQTIGLESLRKVIATYLRKYQNGFRLSGRSDSG